MDNGLERKTRGQVVFREKGVGSFKAVMVKYVNS